MAKAQKILFALLIIFLPSQLGLHFWPAWSYINGVCVDYFSPTVYFTDLLVIALLPLSLRAKRSNLHLHKRDCFVALFLAMTIGVNIYFSTLPWLSFYKWLKIGEMAFLAWFVAKNKTFLLSRLPIFLLVPVVYSCVLALWQFAKQGSVGGIWYWLGERSFNNSTPGIALASFNGQMFLRPYATFPHPNVLMGFLMVAGLLILTQFPHISRKITAVVLGLLLIVLVLLPSRGNLLTGWGLRMQLNQIAIQQWLKSPLFGTGLGTSPLYPRNIANFSLLHQPIHNLYFLSLSETGLIGLGIFVILLLAALWKKENIRHKIPLLAIMGLGLFDHYFLTLQQGQLLFAIVLGTII
ncbi:hypothetical protein M1403_02820 [Patescibacteria group bacterium]|nr:hypothetical protein [Patescibacteria group bacterium]